MSARSAIEWTDATWNPVRGCTRVSPGCGGPNHEGGCYAERIAARFSDPGRPFHGFAERTPQGGRWTGKVALVEDALTLPLRWKKPRRIFVNSMSDLFHEALPETAIDWVFAVMMLAPQHTFQVLTKRAQRMQNYIAGLLADQVLGINRLGVTALWTGMHGPDVCLGVSVERQQEADERREHLRALADAGWTTFVSYEPALGPIDWTGWEFLRQLISGGESGPRARPSHPDWHRAARDFCLTHGIAYFFKQWGEWVPQSQAPDGLALGDFASRGLDGTDGIWCVGKKRAGRLLDGREWNESPAASPVPKNSAGGAPAPSARGRV